MSTVISVENVSKAYRLGQIGGGTLKEDFSRWWAKLRGQPDPSMKIGEEHYARRMGEVFWALDDVSFEVKDGEVLGIIGRNGAGKSTLLKILSQVTTPTTGQIKIKGRIASLLEVGTGFNPEMTGRENVFLNGSILGMTKAEIRRRFDEIVAFSGVEEFIDTPVKRYSSGMYVRLAFAVAAHLEPEILIIDEVLAVGDADFQKKCLGKMQDVSKGGRTVLFVSHNMNAVESLCHRVVYLEKGKTVAATSNIREVIGQYLTADTGSNESGEWNNGGGIMQNPWFYPTRFFIGDEFGRPLKQPLRNDEPIYVHIEGQVEEHEIALNVGYGIYDENNLLLYWSATTDSPESKWPKLEKGFHRLKSQFPARFVNQGTYRIDLLIALYYRQWISCPGSNAPSIKLSIQGGLSDSPYWVERRPGVVAPTLDWIVQTT